MYNALERTARDDMPRISEFFGISIYIYYREHMPPHFHAVYSGEEVLISINDLSVLAGRLPPRAMGLVIEWAAIHVGELQSVWEQAMVHEPLSRIEPLR